MKTANQIDIDYYTDDGVGVGDGNFEVLMILLMMSGMNSETLRFHGEPMPRSLGLGVLWALNDVRPARTPHPTQRRILNHWDR